MARAKAERESNLLFFRRFSVDKSRLPPALSPALRAG